METTLSSDGHSKNTKPSKRVTSSAMRALSELKDAVGTISLLRSLPRSLRRRKPSGESPQRDSRRSKKEPQDLDVDAQSVAASQRASAVKIQAALRGKRERKRGLLGQARTGLTYTAKSAASAVASSAASAEKAAEKAASAVASSAVSAEKAAERAASAVASSAVSAEKAAEKAASIVVSSAASVGATVGKAASAVADSARSIVGKSAFSSNTPEFLALQNQSVESPTPASYWFTPSAGWPTPGMVGSGDTWSPPPLLMPTAEEAPVLFD